MRRLLLPFLVLLVTSGCDSGGADEPFSFTVSAETANGDPVPGLSVFVQTLQGASGPEAKGGNASVFFAPNPFLTSARVQLSVAQSAPVSLDLLAVDSTLVQTLVDQTVEEGSYSYVLDGDLLPGGVYRLRLVSGDERSERWIIHADRGVDDEALGPVRDLGTLGADGSIQTTDRTVAPGLFDLPMFVWTDDQGNDLGTFMLSRSVAVIVTDGSRTETVTRRLTDGSNEVTVVW